MVIFMLAECSQCGSRYAIVPDASAPKQWVLFERKPKLNQPSHINVGGLLCLNGHALEVTVEEAAQTEDGHWLVLTVSHPQPVLN